MTNGIEKHLANLGAVVDAIADDVDLEEISDRKKAKFLKTIEKYFRKLGEIGENIDPTHRPAAFFDPTDPQVTAKVVSLALVAQERNKLQTLNKFYGAGIYAIYYTGDNEIYEKISKTETPIYVGKASPSGNPQSFKAQGLKLYLRLNEHKLNIRKVAGIEIEDFEFRYLAVQSGFESAAEIQLINLFRPIWNNETKILYGIGKHGDSAITRSNNKSPFDTVHPGRKWAVDNPEKTHASEHVKRAKDFLEVTKIYLSRDQIIEAFFEDLRNI